MRLTVLIVLLSACEPPSRYQMLPLENPPELRDEPSHDMAHDGVNDEYDPFYNYNEKKRNDSYEESFFVYRPPEPPVIVDAGPPPEVPPIVKDIAGEMIRRQVSKQVGGGLFGHFVGSVVRDAVIEPEKKR